MANKSAIQTNLKRARLIKKYERKRAELQAIVKDKSTNMKERFEAMKKLSKLPRNSSKVRYRNRDQIDGRPRGYIGEYGISRLNFRKLASLGLLPGVKKSSW